MTTTATAATTLIMFTITQLVTSLCWCYYAWYHHGLLYYGQSVMLFMSVALPQFLDMTNLNTVGFMIFWGPRHRHQSTAAAVMGTPTTVYTLLLGHRLPNP